MDELKYMKFPGNTCAKYNILYMLLEAQGTIVPWEQIATCAGTTAEEARRYVKSLLDQGFPVEIHGHTGCVIPADEDILSPSRIYKHLRTRALGRHIRYTFTTASTNDDAKCLAAGSPDGTLVICETQTKGKGRLGRQWESPRGGIFMSLILKPQIQPTLLPPLSLVVGYATATALSRFGLQAVAKWPNDVLAKGRKLSGILCEIGAAQGKLEYVVVGIGINANISTAQMPSAVRHRSTSILDQTGRRVDRNLVIAEVLSRFEPVYLKFLESGIGALIPEIQGSMVYVGSSVVISNRAMGSDETYSGVLQGLDEHGRLLLRTCSGEIQAFAAGDLSLRPQ